MNNKQTKKCKAREMASNLKKQKRFGPPQQLLLIGISGLDTTFLDPQKPFLCVLSAVVMFVVMMYVCVWCEERTVDVATVAPSFHKLSSFR
jgi:hypothetical protein